MKIEEHFMFFFEHMMDMVFLVEYKGNQLWYTKVNRSAQERLGIDMVGKKLVEVLPPSTFEFLNTHYLTCIKSQHSVTYSDLNLFVPDMPASETTLTPVNDGDKTYILAITKNVNERKTKDEDYLFLHSLVANTVDAMLVIDCNGKVLKVNEAFTTQFGWSEAETLGQDWHQLNFIPKKLKIQTGDSFLTLKQGNIVPTQETIRVTKEGIEIHTSVSYSPILDEQQNVAAISMIYRNIQHLRELEQNLEKSKEAYKSLFSYQKNAIFILNNAGIVEKINEACVAITGYTKEQIIGLNYIDFVGDQLPIDPFEQSLQGQINSFETMIHHANSSKLFFNVSYVPIIVCGEVTGVYVIAQDITEQKKMERALKASEEKFRLITEHSSDLIKVVKVDGTISYASPSYRNILGKDYENLLGETFLYGLDEKDKPILQDAFNKLCETDEQIVREYRYKNTAKSEVWVEVHGTPIHREGELANIILTGRIISERKQLQKQLTFQAYHDSLTSLPNRRLLEQELERTIATAKEENGKLALLFLDCDNFKQINDTYGHEIGDQLLVALSKRLEYCVRGQDMVARLGGDEFVILVKTLKDTDHIKMVANRIHDSLQKTYLIEGHKIHATSSIGISLYPQNGSTTKELFRKADQALYTVKKSGRNNYQLYK
ncbi:PAS domain S-box protein [Sutcliffiella deserti]|uniref:PAS domain S-box protein n=1 Tax=Sutcliffiella deserti TaxID=2875501 RepID=UPI001CC15571|nr:PAS domain S-box protein [Sutcliffiella deserti]